MSENNINYIADIVLSQNKIKTWEEIIGSNPTLNVNQYLNYLCVVHSIPKTWKTYICTNTSPINVKDKLGKIKTEKGYVKVEELISKYVYSQLVLSESKPPTSAMFWNKVFLNLRSESWSQYFTLIFTTTIHTYSREFQYKILHNYLPVNSLLYKWNLTDTPRCSLRFLHNETLTHIFGDCFVTKNLYFRITDWLKPYNIKLPELSPINILFGTCLNQKGCLQNHIILIFKMVICRNKSSGTNLFDTFKRELKDIYATEHKIALSKNKLSIHLTKWEQLSELFITS